MSFQVSKKDRKSILDHCENFRKGIVSVTNLRKAGDSYRDNQRVLMAVSSQTDYKKMISARKSEIMASLSDGYLAVRVAVLRVWIHTCIECEGTSPWRLHWPEDRGDDDLLEHFVIVLSMRYTT